MVPAHDRSRRRQRPEHPQQYRGCFLHGAISSDHSNRLHLCPQTSPSNMRELPLNMPSKCIRRNSRVLPSLFFILTISMLLQQSSQQSRCLLLPSCEGKSQISKTVATSIKSSANSPASSSVGLPIDSAATPTLVKSRKRPGTRITGVGSQSFRNRSVFANEGNSRVSTKATFSALSGDMQHNSENQSAQASGSSELDGNARSFHVKLSEVALYFSQDNCSNRVVGLTVRK